MTNTVTDWALANFTEALWESPDTTLAFYLVDSTFVYDTGWVTVDQITNTAAFIAAYFANPSDVTATSSRGFINGPQGFEAGRSGVATQVMVVHIPAATSGDVSTWHVVSVAGLSASASLTGGSDYVVSWAGGLVLDISGAGTAYPATVGLPAPPLPTPPPFTNQRVTADGGPAAGDRTLLTQPFGHTWKDPASDVGSGEISLPYGDSQVPLVAPNNWVTFKVDSGSGPTDAATMVVETTVDGQVDPALQGGLSYKASGRTHVCEWERNLLQPEEGPMVQPLTTVRYFNFSSKYLDDSAWTESVIPYTIPGMFGGPWVPPKNWPDMFASWTWSRVWSGGLYSGPFSTIGSFSTPVGVSYVRKHIHLDTAADIVIYIVADDNYQLWVDNKLVLEGDPAPATNYAETCQRVEGLSAGDHIISVKVTNFDPGFTGGNVAGLALTVFALTGLTDHIGASNYLTHTGLVGSPGSLVNDGFVWLDYPAAVPGFTPGHMVEVWRDEFVARGGANWVLDFSDTEDSAGNAWAITPEYAFNIGTDGLTMLRQIGETDVDWLAVPGSRTLQMWNKGTRGATRSSVLSRTTNLVTATYTTEV